MIEEDMRTEEEQEEEPEFETLKADNDYEISTTYPFIIRKKENKKVIKMWKNDEHDYLRLKLNGKHYYFHRVIALQWLSNPLDFNQVDHINHNKMDNRLENLRWVSNSMNQKNKGTQGGIIINYVDELSDDAIELINYGDHYFEDYWFDNGKFYFYTGRVYREITYFKNNCGSLSVRARDTENIQTTINLSKFKRLYNLI